MSVPRISYRFIADDLRRKIKDGTYTRMLPSTGKIGLQYGVARFTAERAVETLKGEGLVETAHGFGVFVAGTIDHRPLTERIVEMMRENQMCIGAPFPSEAALAEEFGVGRNKMRTALAHLEGQGLIGRPQGARGRIVLALPDKEDT